MNSASLLREQHFGVHASASDWVEICELDEIVPGTGVAALIGGEQIAVIRPRNAQDVYAVSNFDPFSKAYVMSRGIVGDKGGVLKIASPIYKQNFNLATGECLDDATVKLATYPARVRAGKVEVAVIQHGGAE